MSESEVPETFGVRIQYSASDWSEKKKQTIQLLKFKRVELRGIRGGLMETNTCSNLWLLLLI